jgi:hypothetical protein
MSSPSIWTKPLRRIIDSIYQIITVIAFFNRTHHPSLTLYDRYCDSKYQSLRIEGPRWRVVNRFAWWVVGGERVGRLRLPTPTHHALLVEDAEVPVRIMASL